MDIFDIYAKIDAGDYTPKLPFVSIREDRDAFHAYDRERAQLEEQFKFDALRAVRLESHPKANKIFKFALEDAHSSGFHAVLQRLDDLRNLID